MEDRNLIGIFYHLRTLVQEFHFETNSRNALMNLINRAILLEKVRYVEDVDHASPNEKMMFARYVSVLRGSIETTKMFIKNRHLKSTYANNAITEEVAKLIISMSTIALKELSIAQIGKVQDEALEIIVDIRCMKNVHNTVKLKSRMINPQALSRLRPLRTTWSN